MLLPLLLQSGCAEKPSITEVNFEEQEFASFVEPDFPFITTSLDGRRLGEGFPEDNLSARVVALRLGNDAYVGFDTDMLRWSVAWTGDFMPMVTMAQISYNDFHNKDNELPVIAGEPKIATGQYPGWNGPEARFEDPRPLPSNPDGFSWGPIPEEIGRWNGLYVIDQEAVLSYTVRGSEIFEKPGSVTLDNETAFTRTLQVERSSDALSMVAAEVTDGLRSEVQANTAYIYHGENEGNVTAVGLVGEKEGVELKINDNRYMTVKLSPQSADRVLTLVLWRGKTDKQAVFEQMLAEAKVEMPQFRQGGPSRWEGEVLTQGQVSPDTAAYVHDMLTLPIPNPWKRNVRVVDVAFFESGQAALVTFEGDVWILTGINEKLDRLKWSRFASGIYEPQSIEVVQDQIYVFGREGILRLHDLNSDGEADYYENFSNLMAQSIETREWASGLVADPHGGFYVSKFGGLDMGPETSSPKSLTGFRAGSPHDGSVIKISADGRSMERYATGFRGPYIGINPETGVVSASDQQGHYVPSTPIMLIQPGDYYGVEATAHLDPVPEATSPLLWIPHAVDRSGVSQVWINSDKMGPLNGDMVHLSYGRPGLFRVLIDSTAHTVQGGVAFIQGNYPAPTMKGAIHPGDGQLYVTGFSLWGTNTETISAFTRMRYTGTESLLPEEFSVRNGAITLRFGVELDEQSVKNISNYTLKRWNYLRSEKYGSGHFKTDGTVGEENLPVLGAHLSDDRNALLLAVPNIAEVMQMELSYNLQTAEGSELKDAFWFTVNEVADPNMLLEGFSAVNEDDLDFDFNLALLDDESDVVPTVNLGEELFLKMGCNACHAVDGQANGKIGPSMQGLFGSERHLEDSTPVMADEAYIRESIIAPGEKVVKGYADVGMPSFLGILSDNEIQSVVLYIKSLE